MTNSVGIDLTYEKQESAAQQRMCGAAALCMVYRSFGAPSTQLDVWRTISRPDAGGSFCARSHLLCADALERGFAAMTLQVRTPWPALQLATAHAIRVIVNYRMRLSARAGHFAVVVRVEENSVVLHDPQMGPQRRVTQTEFLKLWQPGTGGSEVTGNILLAFAARPREGRACRRCGATAPASIPCPACRKRIPLQPGVVLGCVDNDCGERVWERVFCSHCDAALSELGRPNVSEK